MIKDSQWFEFNNRVSTEFGIINCNLSSSMLEEPFVAESEIVETEIRGRDEPYLQEVKQKPLVLNLTFAFEDSWTDESLQKVKRWLRQLYYCPLRFSENPNRIYYCILTSEPKLSHNARNQGYFECQFRCKGSYAYSPTYIDPHDFSSSNVNYFEFNNLGDVEVLPIIEITKVGGAGGVSIFNLSDSNREFGFSELADNEVVTADCKRRDIESSISGVYRYDKLINSYYMSIPFGVNRLKVSGKCKIILQYEFRFD